MILDGDLIPEVLVCPSGVDEPAQGTALEELAAELLKRGHCSYIYFGSGRELTPNPDAMRVIAVELLDNHRREGINVFFADGHADWLEDTVAEALLLKLGFKRAEAAATR